MRRIPKSGLVRFQGGKVIVYVLVTRAPGTRLVRPDFLDQAATLGSRSEIWTKSLSRLGSSPVFGPGRLMGVSGVVSPHNAVLSMSELGGLLGLVAGLGAFVALAAWGIRLGRWCIPMLACTLIASMTIDTLVHPLAWIMLGLGCSSALSDMERDRPPGPRRQGWDSWRYRCRAR
jgi:hypothetical protein